MENRYNDKCDKYDYLTAVGTGALAGIIDIFFVGSPADSKLLKWTDSQVNNFVKSFAGKLGWKNNNDNVHSAIAFLEKKFPVNYDQRYGADVGGLFNMSASNHHMKSLAHSPDIVGLFFSVLNQFTGTSSFISKGKLITVSAGTYELKGGNFIAKIFAGVANWFGHLMSDIAGSKTSIGRGEGIVMPFYELFGFCKFGNRSFGNLATIATKAFEEGYDARFGLTMAMPVLVSDLLTRLIWALRRHFQYGYSIKDCLPTKQHDDLRVMLLVSSGVLCFMDGIDAAIRSGGNPLLFFTRLNLIAWGKLLVQIVREVAIRCKKNDDEDSVSPDFYIDEESKQIFLESPWKQVVNGDTVDYHVSSFWFYLKMNWNKKANKHLALAIVLATSEGIDTEEMINLYFSNGGSAKHLGDMFRTGWFCSPDYHMAKQYYNGNYSYDLIEVTPPSEKNSDFEIGTIVYVSYQCLEYLNKKGIFKNVSFNYSMCDDWKIINYNDTQYLIEKYVNGRKLLAWVNRGSCKLDMRSMEKREYIASLFEVGTYIHISKKCLNYLNGKGLFNNISNRCDVQSNWQIIDYNDTQYQIMKIINGKKITAWVKHSNCID